MTRVLGWIVVAFFILVGFNYLGTLTGNFFAAHHLGYGGAALAEYPFGGSSAGLSNINLVDFEKSASNEAAITQGYGRTSFSYAYVGDWHNGIDIAAVYGAPIYSPAAGTVIATGNQDDYCYRRGFGKYIAVKTAANENAGAKILWFAHLGSINVAPGDVIIKGSLLGTVGATGFETGTHLHFSVFSAAGFSMPPRNGCGPDPTGQDENPLSYLRAISR